MKIIIFGASGMAGHMVYDYLNSLDKYKVMRTIRGSVVSPEEIKLNIENTSEVANFMESEYSNVDIAINCIGLLVADSIRYPDRALLINSWFPRYLERRYKDTKTKVIHLSTDCIFDGRQNDFYHEEDKPTETNFYGRSKALGEINNTKDLTFRMSIIGPEIKQGTGLFHWFMGQSGSVDGYCGQMWNGVTTLELARAIDSAIDQDLCGLYHLVNNQKISKYDLLQLFKQHFNKDINIVKSPNGISDKCLFNNRVDFNFTVPTFSDMIADLKKWMTYTGKYNTYSTNLG